MEIERRIAGPRYSENSTHKTRYINLAGMYRNIVGRNLFSKDPRVLLTTFDRNQEEAVKTMQEWLNQELPRTEFGPTFRRIVHDALTSIGIAKVGIATPADAAMYSWRLEAGDPYFCRVDLDDFVFDTTARDFAEVGYIGYRFRAVKEAVESSKMFDKKGRQELMATKDRPYNEDGDERIRNIGRNSYEIPGEFEEMVDLWYMYCPRMKREMILSDNQIAGPSGTKHGVRTVPLFEREYIGHEKGPIRVLAYDWIPGNPFPKGPIQDIMDLDDAFNQSYRKLTRQAARLKEITVVRKGNQSDMAAIKESSDGDIVPVDNPEATKVIVQGGPNQALFLFMQKLMKDFSWAAGNLDVLGGLASQAETFGQEQLLANQSSGQVASMQDTTGNFAADIVESLGWLYWHHPQKVMQTKKALDTLPGIWVNQELHPWTNEDPNAMKRDGEMPQIKIDLYSLKHTTPERKASQITQVVTQVLAPMMTAAQQQGKAFNFSEFLETISTYWDLPELKKIMMTAEPPPEVETGKAAGTPTETTRNYVRRSTGGNSARAQEAQMEVAAEVGSNGRVNGY